MSGGMKALALSAMASCGRRHLRGARVEATTKDFCGVVHTSRMTGDVAARFLRRASGLPVSELAELLRHPGGGQTLTPAWQRSQPLRDFYTSPWRNRELDVAYGLPLPGRQD